MTAARQGGADIACPLCGARYSEAEGRACSVACPLHQQCGWLRCPSCGHEVPAPTRLTRWLSRWFGRTPPPAAGEQHAAGTGAHRRRPGPPGGGAG